MARPNFDSSSSMDGGADRAIDGPKISIQELFSLVRHSKFGLLKEAVDYLPTKPFDKSLVQVIPFLSLFLPLSLSL